MSAIKAKDIAGVSQLASYDQFHAEQAIKSGNPFEYLSDPAARNRENKAISFYKVGENALGWINAQELFKLFVKDLEAGNSRPWAAPTPKEKRFIAPLAYGTFSYK